MPEILRVGILASGSGSTFEALYEHIQQGRIQDTEIAFVICNNGPNSYAGVWERAARLGIDIFHVSNLTQEKCTVPIVGGEPVKGTISFEASDRIVDLADERGVNMLLGMGYMKRIIGSALQELEIPNWHPGPLPATAGKHGDGVQEKVMQLGLKYSGPTCHWMDKRVDENGMPMYDSGPIIGHSPLRITRKMNREWRRKGTVTIAKAAVMDREKAKIPKFLGAARQQLAA